MTVGVESRHAAMTMPGVTEVKNANATSTLSQFDYAYDPVGNGTQITTVSGVENYTYDDEGRITAVCYRPRRAARAIRTSPTATTTSATGSPTPTQAKLTRIATAPTMSSPR
jgi:YD repeat-containing protein